MSLFANLFANSAPAATTKNDIFSEKNQYHSETQQAGGQVATEQNAFLTAKSNEAKHSDAADTQKGAKRTVQDSGDSRKKSKKSDNAAVFTSFDDVQKKGKKESKKSNEEVVPQRDEQNELSDEDDSDNEVPQHITLQQSNDKLLPTVEGDASSDEDEKPKKKNEAKPPKLTPEEEAEKLSRTVFVGNLPVSMSQKAIKHLFAKQGDVESVRIRSIPLDPEAKMNRKAAVMTGKVDKSRAPAVAYVVFKNQDDVQKALKLNMTEVDGHHIQVDKAAAPSRKQKESGSGKDGTEYDPGRTLFCGNLHFMVTNEELIQLFSNGEALEGNPELAPEAHGGKTSVEAVRVVRDPASNIGKGFAFVMFRTKAAARAALSLSGKEVHGRPVRLTRVSVQQQAKVKQQRQAQAAVSKPAVGKRPSNTGSAQQRPQGGDRKGVAGGRDGRAGGRGRPLSTVTEDRDWQGTKTKGKGGGVRGGKPVEGIKMKKTGTAPAAGRNSGKRPAVAARKAKAKQGAKK